MKKKIPLMAILIILAICLANKDEIKKMFNKDAPAVCAVCEGECPCPDVDCICDGECVCEVCKEGEQDEQKKCFIDVRLLFAGSHIVVGGTTKKTNT